MWHTRFIHIFITLSAACITQAGMNDVNIGDPETIVHFTEHKRAKVLILGAGVAGITAAKTLAQDGIHDFLIIEGSSRIGGRVKSIKFGGKTVEAGANWMIVKDNRNPLWNTIIKYNISGLKLSGDDVIIRNMEGDDVTLTEGLAAWEKLEAVQQMMKKVGSQISDGTVQDMSLRACLELNSWRPVTPVENIVEVFEYDFEYGNRPDVTSCKSNEKIYDYLQNSLYVADNNGFESVVTNMANEVLEESDTRLVLNEIVQSVHYSSEGVSITTQSGRIYEADYAIMTFSIGVLKSKTIAFNPPLPDWKEQNLFRIRMENYVNIYLKFSGDQFWDTNTFILYADERTLYYPVWINHNSPKFAQQGTNILQIVTVGDEADRISNMPETKVIQEVMSVLRRVYTYNNISDPDDFYITSWSKDPLYAGAFANVEPGVSNDISEAIRSPVQRLYFAGEAYSDFDGYAVGAALSGQSNAKMVASCLKHGKM